MTNMTDLIARLEAASEGSRELDGMIAASLTEDGIEYVATYEIGKAARPIGQDARSPRPDDPKYTWAVFADKSIGAPAFTTSLDAAMALVPEGRSWTASNYCGAFVHPTDPGPPEHGGHKSAAIALCIAALKARSAA